MTVQSKHSECFTIEYEVFFGLSNRADQGVFYRLSYRLRVNRWI